MRSVAVLFVMLFSVSLSMFKLYLNRFKVWRHSKNLRVRVCRFTGLVVQTTGGRVTRLSNVVCKRYKVQQSVFSSANERTIKVGGGSATEALKQKLQTTTSKEKKNIYGNVGK